MPDEPQDEPTRDPEDSPVIRDLRKKADRTEALERENAILRSGLKLSDRQVRALIATHEGDWTPDAILETATELGFHRVEEPEREEIPEEELAAQDRIQQASAGAEAPGSESPSDQIAQAQTPEEVIAIAEKAGVRLAE